MREKLINNLSLKILAVVFAVFLWFVVVNIDDPVRRKTYTNIQVTVTNEAVVTSKGRTYQIIDNSGTVSVTVKAKQSILQKIKDDDIQVIADLKELMYGSMVPLEVSIPKYEGGYESEETYASPGNLQVEIEENASKKFPITPVATGTVRDGFVVGTMAANPEQVTIRGPESAINSIAKVQAEVNVNGLAADATLDSELIFYDENDKVVDATLLSNNLGEEGVSVDVTIHKIKRVAVKFDTSKITTETGYYLGEITYEPVELRVTGTQEELDKVTEIDVPSEALEMSGLTEKAEKMVDITPYIPEGVKLVDENANTVLVTVNVEQGGMKTINWSIGSISVRNPPAGYKVSFGDTEEVKLQIRGTKQMLDQLNLGSEDVYINLADCQVAGKYTVPVEVRLPVGYSLAEVVKIDIELIKE